MVAMLDWALRYLELGWSVFPVHPGTKKPLVDSWQGFMRRPPTEAQVRLWWSTFPTANIAVVTGRLSGLVVVDVDPQHGGDRDGLPPTGCVQVTRNGGTQHFYAYPAGAERIPNRVNVDDSGRDVRADGGYVIVAPSIVPADGDGPGRYTWERFEPSELSDDVPSWAIEPSERPVDEQKDPWLNRLLLQGAPSGERNTSLVRIAGYYAKLGLPLDAALTLAHQWSHRLDHPLPADEVDVTVRSAYKMERRRQRDAEPKVVNDELLPMLTHTEYMEKHGSNPVKWLIRDWMPEQSITFLVSPPQSYKSFLTLDLAVAVASGEPFLGQYPVLNPGPVAVFQQEDFHGNVAERLAVIDGARTARGFAVVDGDRIILPNLRTNPLPIYHHEDRRLRFDDEAVFDALEAFVARVRPRLVIVDPLYSTIDTSRDEYMAKHARKMMRLKDIRDRYQCGFVIVHHSKKGAGTWNREKVWGSQFINAFIETSWLLHKPDDETATIVKRHFKVAGEQPFVKVQFDMQTDQPPYYYTTTQHVISKDEADRAVQGKASKMEDAPNALERPIMEALQQHPLTSKELAAGLDRAEVDVAKTLRGLLAKHRVKQDAIGRWETLDVAE